MNTVFCYGFQLHWLVFKIYNFINKKNMHPYIICKIYIPLYYKKKKNNRVGTSSSSHWKLTCSRRDIAEKLRKQQLFTDPQHDVKNIFCLKHKYLHLLIYYLSGYLRRDVNFAFFRHTVRVGSNFAKIEKKQN